MDGQTNTPPRYVTPKQFAGITGFSLKTVRRRLKDGDLPAHQPGGRRTRWLIDLQAFEAEQNVAPQEPATCEEVPPELTEKPESKRVVDVARPSGPRPRWMAVYPQAK